MFASPFGLHLSALHVCQGSLHFSLFSSSCPLHLCIGVNVIHACAATPSANVCHGKTNGAVEKLEGIAPTPAAKGGKGRSRDSGNIFTNSRYVFPASFPPDFFSFRLFFGCFTPASSFTKSHEPPPSSHKTRLRSNSR